jgi:hypothetical protein
MLGEIGDRIDWNVRQIRQCERIQPGIWCGSPVAFGNEENL